MVSVKAQQESYAAQDQVTQILRDRHRIAKVTPMTSASAISLALPNWPINQRK